VQDPRFTDGCPAIRLSCVHGCSGSGKNIMALSLLGGRIRADAKLGTATDFRIEQGKEVRNQWLSPILSRNAEFAAIKGAG
jgi:hypothetical protein